jgi:hypothetical protein
MILALISELSEFSERNVTFKELFIFETLFISFNLLEGISMFCNNLKLILKFT